MEDKIDLNKFEHMQVEGKGCENGIHIPDDREGNIGIEKDGELTKLIFRCIACGLEYSVSAPLGLNQYLKDGPSKIPEIATQPTMQRNNTTVQPMAVEEGQNLTILREKLG